MKHLIFILLSILAAAASDPAQTVTVLGNGNKLRLEFPKAVAAADKGVYATQANYRFYELFDPNGIQVKANPVAGITVSSPPTWLRVDTWIELNLSQPLIATEIYLLKINNAVFDGAPLPVLRIQIPKKASVKTANDPRDRLIVDSTAELDDASIQVFSTSLSISKDNTKVEAKPTQIAVTGYSSNQTRLFVEFGKPLAEARNHNLKLNLKTKMNTPVTGNILVPVPGLIHKPFVPRIDINLSSEFGGNLKPQFNLGGVFRQRLLEWHEGILFLEPTVNFDVGLGATKAKNSIILSFPTLAWSPSVAEIKGGCTVQKPSLGLSARAAARKNMRNSAATSASLEEGKVESQLIPCYKGWSSTKWGLNSIELSAGPKFETDRTFGRINALGGLKVDFIIEKLQRSISRKREYLAIDLANGDAKFKGLEDDVYIRKGFSLTPRLGLDVGRRLTGEVVKNNSGSIRFNVDPFNIFRAYAGFASTFEFDHLFRPMKFSVAHDWYYLERQERIAAIKDGNLDIRDVRGWHPLSSASIEIALDPVRRYSFKITYENGRSAPNFEYLNVVKPSFRIVY